MRRRATRVILLLYPRRVRTRHGPEIAALIDDLIMHDGRSRARLFIRLAVDGLLQRTATTTTAWTAVAVLAATSLAGLAASGFAAASAHGGAQRTTSSVAPARHVPNTARHVPNTARHVHKTPHHHPDRGPDSHPLARTIAGPPSVTRPVRGR